MTDDSNGKKVEKKKKIRKPLAKKQALNTTRAMKTAVGGKASFEAGNWTSEVSAGLGMAGGGLLPAA